MKMHRLLTLMLSVVMIISCTMICPIFAESTGQPSDFAVLYRYREKVETTSNLPLETPWVLISKTSAMRLLYEYDGLTSIQLSTYESRYSSEDYYYLTSSETGTKVKYTTRPNNTGTAYYFDKALPEYGMYDESQYTYAEHPTTGIKLYFSDVVSTYTLCVYTRYEYKYWKWSEWSDWSETEYTESETVEVETKESNILYRYREKQYCSSKTTLSEPWLLYNTTTAYEHNGFSTIVLKTSEPIGESYCVHDKEYVTKYLNQYGNAFYLTTDELIDYTSRYPSPTPANDGSYYRYKYCTSKTPYPLYHYYMWNEWSDWSYTPVTASDDVEIETKIATIFTILYDANGGTNAPLSITKEFDETITLSEVIPIRENHQFLGWSTSAQGEVEYAPGAEYSANKDVTLYAVWMNVTEYTVTYNAKGGTGAPAQQKKTHNETLTLALEIPTREGYSFLGWATYNSEEVEYGSGGTYENNESIILYAVWSINEYMVVYDANGGTSAPSAQIKEYNEAMTISIEIPAKDGCSFTGWSTTKNGSVQYAPGDTYSSNEDLILYAVWNNITEYTVAYDANGGTGAPTQQKKTNGEALTISSEIPVREGYTFLGWSTTSDGNVEYSSGDTYSLDISVIMYAVWEENNNIIASGICGNNLTWTLDEKGTLTISGTGEMYYWFSSSESPWSSKLWLIKNVTISDGVTSIGYKAFEHCTNLASITISDSVTSIDGDAFYECVNLASVKIGNNVTSIGDYTFYNCKSLTSINIPNSVTSIGAGAFFGCDSLAIVEIPVSVTSIGNRAFSWCESLTNIVIPYGVTSIGDYAFYECESLTSVVIPNSVTSIGDYAFSWCESLALITIPDSVTSIGNRAFSSCDSLTNIVIPDSVRLIGECPFRYCINLENITVENNNQHYSSDEYGVLFDKNKTTLMQYPIANTRRSYTIPNGVTTIGNAAFYGCDSLASIEISNNVTTIGDYAFSSCDSLASIEISNSVTTIGDYAFSGCDSLTSVDIGDNVTSIADEAFYNCSSLTSVEIGDSVTSIGKYAFGWCKSLTSITIPYSVTSISDKAFNNCTNLTIKGCEGSYAQTYAQESSFPFSVTHNWNDGTITVQPTHTSFGELTFTCDDCSATKTEQIAKTTEHSFGKWTNVDTSNHSRSCECGDIETATHSWDSGVITAQPTHTTFGERTFTCNDCSATKTEQIAKTSEHSYGSWIKYDTENHVRSCKCGEIEKESHDWDDGIVTIQPTHTTYGECTYTCLSCSATKAETIPVLSNIKASGKCGKNLTWTLDDEGTLTIFGTGDMYDYSYDYYPWDDWYLEIKKVIIESGVTRVGNYSFYWLLNVKEVSLPDTLISIGDSAFDNCTALVKITIPNGVSNIGKRAFVSCSIETLIIPDSVINIGQSAFEMCEKLSTLVIGKGLSTIDVWTFNSCKSLTEVIIPGNVTEIGQQAFLNCSSITKITLEEGVESIGEFAFWYCSKLKVVELPNTILNIDRVAFADCPLSAIYYRGTQNQWQNIAINSDNSAISIAKKHYVYTITYNANGGSNAPVAQTKEYNVDLVLSPDIPTRNGYSFKGWSTSQDGVSEYYPKDTYVGTNDVTLYAVWTPEIEFFGAQIRTDDPQGLRFVFSIPREKYEALSHPQSTNDIGVGFGSVVMPKKYLGDNELTKDTVVTIDGKEYKAKISPAVNLYEITDDEIKYTVCIIGISPTNYTSEYVAVPYMTYIDDTGEEITIYGECTENITVYSIAELAYQDSNSSEGVKKYLYNNILSIVDPEKYPTNK